MSEESRRERPSARRPLPPGETSRVAAERALVLAPHPDDEVLGCGGLLAQLAAGGARIRVLVLSAAAAGDGENGRTGERGARGERRRRETREALRVLGVSGAAGGQGPARFLDLPDGALGRHLDRVAGAIAEELVTLRPDLVLVPSPLEVSSDHRACFAALHEVLGAIRGSAGGRGGCSEPDAGEELAAVARDLTVLAYEVNHPAYPDLLVDVSGELDLLRRAMACHASQQERHDYLAAGLGLRVFRTLSLPAAGPEGVRAAEGYRRLRAADFAGRSPAQLVRHLGGVPELLPVADGPRISVVVRTRDRPGLLAKALASLAEGTYRRFEVVVVNDGGRPPELPADYPVPLERIDLAESMGRAAAANAGLAACSGEWIGFLDDDDLAAPEHLAVLAGAAAAEGVRAVYSDAAVVSLELDPSGEGSGWREAERRLPYSRDFDPDLLLVDNYIPFNTLLFERALAEELERPEGAEGPFDPELDIFEDWDFLIRLAARAPLHHVRRVTCEYRHYRGAGHHALGERPRERSDFLAAKARVIRRHAERLDPERLARTVDRLRAEAVEASEEAAAERRSRRRAEEERSAAEDRFHRLNGEVVALRDEVDSLRDRAEALSTAAEERGAELERLHREEGVLRETVDDQTEHLRRTYAEIERLNGILDELRGATLPGLVRWWRDQRKGG